MSYRNNDFNNYLISTNNPANNNTMPNFNNLNYSNGNLMNNTKLSEFNNNNNTNISNHSNENDLNFKYNQYKRNLNTSKSLQNPNDIMPMDNNFLNNHLLSNILPDNDNENEQFDRIKISQLKKLYDERIKSLYHQIKLICNRFETDEILHTMKNDSINQEFTFQRLKEIVDENLVNEKENLLIAYQDEITELNSQINYLNKNLNEKMTKNNFDNQDNNNKIKNYEFLLEDSIQKNQNLQNELINHKNQIEMMQNNFESELKKLSDEYLLRSTKLNNDLQKIKNNNITLQDQIALYENKYKEINQEYEENKLEMDRLQKVISVLEIDLNVNEGKLKDKHLKIDSLQHELTNIQTQYFEINLKFKKFQDENKNLESLIEHYEKERKEILDKYNSFNDDLQKSHNEKLENQEKKYKDKYLNLKKKIVELKSIISNLEEELNLEKNNGLDTKINYSKIITKMQEDMKLIKSDYEKIIGDLETKHSIDANCIKQDLLIELENKNKDLLKLKQNSDLLKNFEKEYLRISRHEEILNETLNEMKKKFNQEILIKEEELENEFRKRLSKLDDDKKGEYEFLTDNTRKNLKNLEKLNEELKSNNLDFQNKLNTEKTNNEILNTNNINQQKTIRQFKNEIDDKDIQIKLIK